MDPAHKDTRQHANPPAHPSDQLRSPTATTDTCFVKYAGKLGQLSKAWGRHTLEGKRRLDCESGEGVFTKTHLAKILRVGNPLLDAPLARDSHEATGAMGAYGVATNSMR